MSRQRKGYENRFQKIPTLALPRSGIELKTLGYHLSLFNNKHPIIIAKVELLRDKNEFKCYFNEILIFVVAKKRHVH